MLESSINYKTKGEKRKTLNEVLIEVALTPVTSFHVFFSSTRTRPVSSKLNLFNSSTLLGSFSGSTTAHRMLRIASGIYANLMKEMAQVFNSTSVINDARRVRKHTIIRHTLRNHRAMVRVAETREILQSHSHRAVGRSRLRIQPPGGEKLTRNNIIAKG